MTESGEDFAADGTGAMESGVLTTTVDTERRGDVAASQDRLLKAPFRTALVSISMGGAVMEGSADRASLCLFFAQRSRVTKTPPLSALHEFGGRVGGGDRVCNNLTIGGYNHNHLSPNGIPRGNLRWYGLVYFIQIAGKPRRRPRG